MHIITWCKRQKIECEYIIPFIGVSVTLPTIAILMKHCDGGDLRKLLLKHSQKYQEEGDEILEMTNRDGRSSSSLQQNLLSRPSLSFSLELEMTVERHTTDFIDFGYRLGIALEVAQGIQLLHAANVVHVSRIR